MSRRVLSPIASATAAITLAAMLAVANSAPAHATSEVLLGRIPVSPQSTYLATQNGAPAGVDENVDDTVGIDLAAHFGVHAGDTIRLERRGDFSTHGNPIREDQAGIRETDEMLGVFASSAQLDPRCRLAPAPNNNGIPFDPACWGNAAFNRVRHAVTFFDVDSPWHFRTVDHGTERSIRTDISQDFRIGNTYVTVPEGATHLFVAPHDDGRGNDGVDFGSWYHDNHDVGGDFELAVYRVVPDPPPAPDSVAISIDGYENSGVLQSGNFTVTSRVVRGTGELPGTTGGTATLTVVLNRFLGLPLYNGTVTVRDPGAGFSRRVQLWFVHVDRYGDTARVHARYLDFGRFPPRTGPITLKVADST